MMISIVIPIYNSEETISYTLENLLSQEYQNFEIIVIDDGSSDSSVLHIKKYASIDSRISFYSKENGGVSSARNLGLSYAKGDYIAFIDSDDHISSKMLSEMIDMAENTDSTIIMCGIESVFNVNNATHEFKSTKEVFNLDCSTALNDILDPNKYHGYACNKIYSKNFFRGDNPIRFNEDIHVGEDFLFVVQCMIRAKTIKYTPEKYYKYYRHAENTSNLFNEKKMTLIDSYKNIIYEIQSYNKSAKRKINITPFLESKLLVISSLSMQSRHSGNFHVYKKKIRSELKSIKSHSLNTWKSKMLLIMMNLCPSLIYVMWKSKK